MPGVHALALLLCLYLGLFIPQQTLRSQSRHTVAVNAPFTHEIMWLLFPLSCWNCDHFKGDTDDDLFQSCMFAPD